MEKETVNSIDGKANLIWVMTLASMVFLILPGLAYFYGSMSRAKNSLSLMYLAFLSVAVISIEWFCFGYSMALSPTSKSSFVGNLDFSFFANVLSRNNIINEAVPELAYAYFMGLFACITPAIVIGAVADRGRVFPSIVFMLLWTILVYNFIAYWTWGSNGWAAKLGALDYAGGAPVHIASGFSALAYSVMLGKRSGHGIVNYKPNSSTNMLIGTCLIWFAWFPFNGGSTLKPDIRAVVAFVCTHLSACSGAITWLSMDYFWHEKKFCVDSVCNGVVAGLVAITPAAGLVDIPSSLLFGIVGSICSKMFLRLKTRLFYDDALDIFGIHGIVGLVGSVLTGVFARKHIAALDPTLVIEGGWLDGNWMQMSYQLASSAASAMWSLIMTFVILFVINKVRGLKIRVDPDVEESGIDYAELGSCSHPNLDIEEKMVQRKIQTDTINTALN